MPVGYWPTRASSRCASRPSSSQTARSPPSRTATSRLSATAPNVELIDLKDRFVLPGLIDLHKHISLPLDADEATFASEDRLALMYGPRSRKRCRRRNHAVRDVGDNVGVTFAVRDAINSGVLEGPRIFAAGRIISSTGGHGTTDEFQGNGTIKRVHGGCDGPESCRRVVRENIEAGSDWIKVTVSGSGGAPSGLADAQPIMFPDEVHAVMEAAARVATGCRARSQHGGNQTGVGTGRAHDRARHVL